MQLISIPTDEVAAWWPVVARILDRASRRGPHSTDELLAFCAGGAGRLLVVLDGPVVVLALVVTIAAEPTGREAHILAAAGSRLDVWVALSPEFEGWARHHGATLIKFDGRLGWSRVAPGYDVLARSERSVAHYEKAL